MKTIALIDGDVLAYFAAYNAYQRYVTRYEKEEVQEHGRVLINLDEHGNKVARCVRVEDEPDCLMDALAIFKKDVKHILDNLYAEDKMIAIKGNDNFRDYFFEDYKKPRHKRAKSNPVSAMVTEVRKLLEYERLAKPAHGREADDYLRIWQLECLERGDTPVICSVDKDLRCIPGLHYHLKTKEVIKVEETEGLRFFYSQLLQGDPTDNIPGLAGVGPKKADAVLEGVTDELEMQEIVVSYYLEKMGEDAWLDFLNFNGKLLHIQRHEEDWFDASEWELTRSLHA